MSKQVHESQTTRAHDRCAAVACAAASKGRKPIAFAQQLAARSAGTYKSAAFAPAPSASFSARFTQSFFAQCIRRLGKRLFKQRGRLRKLELQEIQQLGEKRFLAIVRVGKQKFLIGGAAASVSLLAEIHGRTSTVVVPPPLGQERA